MNPCSPSNRVRAIGAMLLLVALVGGCASFATRLEPPEVTLIGLEPLAAEGNLEQRIRVSVRVANPNDRPFEFDGVDLTVDLNGQRFARALGNERVTLPRLSDAVVTLTATTHVFSILRQVMALPGQDGIDYAVRGRIFLADSPGWVRVAHEGTLADLGGR